MPSPTTPTPRCALHDEALPCPRCATTNRPSVVPTPRDEPPPRLALAAILHGGSDFDWFDIEPDGTCEKCLECLRQADALLAAGWLPPTTRTRIERLRGMRYPELDPRRRGYDRALDDVQAVFDTAHEAEREGDQPHTHEWAGGSPDTIDP